MDIFLVGGSVRDTLLDLPTHDNDWVVVGATPDELISQGYQPVGKDFPVFLHPKTHEEYALARTEKKAGTGYTGFTCTFSPDVTLEQDLSRRDLTINAIAQAQDGRLIDPFHGIDDIRARILRHVSPAFVEDPLRVLRVARFAARFASLGFTIAPETRALMRDIVNAHELETLSVERLWKETEKALITQNPVVYFQTLRECGALEIVFPELSRLFADSDDEKNRGQHAFDTLEQATTLTQSITLRFAALCHDISRQAPDAVQTLCDRLKLPTAAQDLLRLGNAHYVEIQRAITWSAEKIIRFFDEIDIWRKPHRLDELLLIAQADLGILAASDFPPASRLTRAYHLAVAVPVQPIIDAGFTGKQIRETLLTQRIAAIDSR